MTNKAILALIITLGAIPVQGIAATTVTSTKASSWGLFPNRTDSAPIVENLSEAGFISRSVDGPNGPSSTRGLSANVALLFNIPILEDQVDLRYKLIFSFGDELSISNRDQAAEEQQVERNFLRWRGYLGGGFHMARGPLFLDTLLGRARLWYEDNIYEPISMDFLHVDLGLSLAPMISAVGSYRFRKIHRSFDEEPITIQKDLWSRLRFTVPGSMRIQLEAGPGSIDTEEGLGEARKKGQVDYTMVRASLYPMLRIHAEYRSRSITSESQPGLGQFGDLFVPTSHYQQNSPLAAAKGSASTELQLAYIFPEEMFRVGIFQSSQKVVKYVDGAKQEYNHGSSGGGILGSLRF